jgi:predicted MFS family arabinose efflux permease
MIAQFIGEVNQWHATIISVFCLALAGCGAAWLLRDPNWLKKQRLESSNEMDKLRMERDMTISIKKLEVDSQFNHAKLEQGLITSHREA